VVSAVEPPEHFQKGEGVSFPDKKLKQTGVKKMTPVCFLYDYESIVKIYSQQKYSHAIKR